MKKLLIVAAVVLALALVTVGLTAANGGPHGGYTPTTDACAGCHRAHTAQAPYLLVTDEESLCLSCHGSAGNGANTNVEDGLFLSTRNPSSLDGVANTPDGNALLGGGFVNYKGVAVTSSHDVSGSNMAAWGNGVNRGVTGALSAGLECASCHNPHGSPNYRIINTTINSATPNVTVAQVDEGAAKDYDTENWGTGQSQVCAACHKSYHVTTAGSGSDPTLVATGGYTHRIDMPYNYDSNANPETVGMGGLTLPLAESGSNNTVVCQTCHLPHGTSAAMTGFASGAGPAADSALLRLDNRGVCEVCHQK